MVLVFSSTLFLSAALLMSIQPLFAKAILPLFGGAPQVWNICMMFYQILLLAGYLFAHWSSQQGRRGLYLQLVLLGLPLLFLPIGVSVLFADDLLISNPALALLAVLASSVALPFFVLSTLSPLLQRWLSYTSSEHADDPYFLYAASNLGSFLGLLAYPLLVEPLWPMEQQSQYWSLMYGLLIVGVCSCAVVVLRGRKLNAKPERGQGILYPAALGWTVNLRWLGLAFIPSSLMHAVSMHMVSEVASIPLLWVMPLGIYLLIMALCFARTKLIPHHWFVTAAPGVVLLILLLLVTAAYDPIGIILPLHLLGLFVLCMLFHGELARSRPATQSLTWFYIVLAMGGALGGIFNSLLAPLLFNSIAEYPLILLAATAFIPLRDGAMTPTKPLQQRLLMGLLPASLMLGFYEVLELLQAQELIGQALVGLLGKVLVLLLPFLGCYLLLKDRLTFALATLCCAGLAYLVNSDNQVIHAQRTFFGVHTVL